MSGPAPVERAAHALVRHQAARFDGFAVGLDDLEPESREDALDDARVVFASIDRDELARVLIACDGCGCPDCLRSARSDADAVLAWLRGDA